LSYPADRQTRKGKKTFNMLEGSKKLMRIEDFEVFGERILPPVHLVYIQVQ